MSFIDHQDVAGRNLLAQQKLIQDLGEARAESGQSIVDVAALLDVEPNIVADLESGKLDLTLSEIRQYAIATGAVVRFQVEAAGWAAPTAAPAPDVEIEWAVQSRNVGGGPYDMLTFCETDEDIADELGWWEHRRHIDPDVARVVNRTVSGPWIAAAPGEGIASGQTGRVADTERALLFAERRLATANLLISQLELWMESHALNLFMPPNEAALHAAAAALEVGALLAGHRSGGAVARAHADEPTADELLIARAREGVEFLLPSGEDADRESLLLTKLADALAARTTSDSR
jgi:transcriptional regulator with XRE-family HTH domain